MADDRTPPRLDIRLPASLGAELARSAEASDSTRAGGPGAKADSYLYTCKTCESANFVDRVSYNVTACPFTEYVYPNPAMERARKGHNCRYFDDAPLAAVCQALAQGEHGTDHAQLLKTSAGSAATRSRYWRRPRRPIRRHTYGIFNIYFVTCEAAAQSER